MKEKDNIINEIEVLDKKEDFYKYEHYGAWKVLKHKDYCCPFCSHGETIKLRYNSSYHGNLMGTSLDIFLECSRGCMRVGLFEGNYLRGSTPENELKKSIPFAKERFAQLIKFTKDRTEFILV